MSKHEPHEKHGRGRSKRRASRSHGPWRGPGPDLRSILALIDDRGLSWEELAGDVLPLFERARPFPFEVDPPVRVVVPPGVTIGFGVGAGPAFLRVAETHLAAWPVDRATLTERAIDNLRARAARLRGHDLVREPIDGVPTVTFQSRAGWASTAILVPEAIERLFGPEPRLFIAPARDLLVGLPPDVEPEFATWLTEELEALDPNALRLEGFEWRARTVRCRALRRSVVRA
jgi:hypothetical protein